MYYEIEELEREIVEFRKLLKESSEILGVLEGNTKDIETLKTLLGESAGNIQAVERKLVDTIVRLNQVEERLEMDLSKVNAELGGTVAYLRSLDQKLEEDVAGMVARQAEIAALGRRTNSVLVAAILGIITGIAGVVIGLLV